jgi:hypothetical protein
MDKNKNKNKLLYKVTKIKDQFLVSDQCVVAKSFLLRAKGLIGKRKIAKGEALLISPCNSIHMWFMSIPIDVAFLKRKKNGVYEVTSIHQNLVPWRLLPVGDSKAQDTLEFPSGTLERSSIHVGDLLCLS